MIQIKIEHRDTEAFTMKRYFSGFYERLEDAESGLVQIVNIERSNYLNFYCFYIKEALFNRPQYCYEDVSYSIRLYDASGKKIDERLYPSYFLGNYFNGRKKEKLRFKVGDMVEYQEELWVVVSVPEEHYDRMLGSGDDCYCVIHLEQDFESQDGAYHTHPECINDATKISHFGKGTAANRTCKRICIFKSLKESRNIIYLPFDSREGQDYWNEILCRLCKSFTETDDG